MTHKVNIQARIKRHSRILKDNLGNTLHYSSNNSIWYKIVAAIILLLFPLYPVFASLGDTRTSFYRGDIDEDSILESFELGEDGTLVDDNTLFESKDSFLSVGALVEDDSSSSSKLITYEVQEGDSLEAIAKKYNVSKETIIWANNLDDKVKELKKGTKLTFPPVTGVIYKVKRGDTVSAIAKKYHVYTKDIISQNGIKNNYLKISQELIIPGGKFIKEEKKVKSTYKKSVYTRNSYKKTYKKKTSYIVENTNSKGRFPLKWHKPYSGAWGNCTWYVASYKAVDWRGNANQWLRNARKKGHATGNYAVNGAIVVLGGRGYNRRYGHVAIVREVHKDYLIVSDMNYRRLGQVTVRKIKRYGSHIRGYIYVN